MTRASKPGIPAKVSGNTFSAAEVNALDTAIDNTIDDYFSTTQTTTQSIASPITLTYSRFPATYTVFKIGSTYYAMDSSGTVTSNASASTLLQSLIDAMTSGGVIHLKGATTYTLTAPLTFTGNAADDFMDSGTIDRVWTLEGEGWSSIVAQTGSGEHGIILTNGVCVRLCNFQLLNQNAGATGNAIISSKTGVDTDCGTGFSVFEDLLVAATDDAVNLVNPMAIHMRHVWINSFSGHCLILENDSTTLNYGNSCFDHLYLLSAPSGHYGLKMIGTDSKMNLNQFNGLFIGCPGCGINLVSTAGGDVEFNEFNAVDLETGETGVKIEGAGICSGNKFSINYLGIAGGMTGIDLTDNSGTNGGNAFDMQTVVNSGTYIIDEHLNGTQNRFRFVNIWMPNNNVLNEHAYASIWEWNGYNVGGSTVNPKRGSAANISDGGTITHNLGVAPTWVTIVGTVADEIVAVTATSTTTFTVAIKKRADGSAGTAQTIYYACGWNN